MLMGLALGMLAVSVLAAVPEAAAVAAAASAAVPGTGVAAPEVVALPRLAARPVMARPVIARTAMATACGAGGVEADLHGSGDTAVVSGRARVCHSTAGAREQAAAARPYFTYEIVCSTDRARAAEGLCSATPCSGGTHFALRTLHRPGGRVEPAGSSCIRLDRAVAAPGLTAADVFAVVSGVALPTGAIRAVPSARGLANLPADLWLVGDELAPVDLRLAGSTIHAEFQPVAYRWSFGSGRASRPGPVVRASADPSGRHGAAGVVFPGSGEFAVSVVTEWSATASLDGRFVGQVDGLVSTARLTYPVVELRTDLDG
jgi:hypothetical protein